MSEKLSERSEIERLTTELERAYRCIRGFYSFAAKGQTPDAAFMGYQILTIAAAVRFVHEGSLDGSEYFIGKQIDVLQYVLNPPKGPKQ